MRELTVKGPEGPLVTLVDDEDYERVSKWSWEADSRGYVSVKIMRGGIRKRVMLHRFLLDTDAPQVDHRDGNPLNNQRSNLRPCTSGQNQAARRVVSGRSRFKGVWFDHTGKAVARIRIPGGRRIAKSFKNEEQAAAWYSEMAREHWGEFV